MAQYSNQFTINICEIGRIIFTDVVNINENEQRVTLVADIAMYPEALKGLADMIYKTLEDHKQATEASQKAAN